MSNSPQIEPVSNQNMITGEASHAIHIYDDHGEAMLVIPYSEISLQPIDLVIKLTELQHEPENYGQDSCEVIEDILNAIKKDGIRVRIGNEDYRYEDLKDALDWDWRNLYECPTCGWQSFDDDSHDCGRCKRIMQFVRQEHYEL